MQIFPHTLVRIGGESFDHLKSLENDALGNWIVEIPNQNKRYLELKEKLSSDLLLFIQLAEDTHVQKVLQNLRRDLFNERKPKPAELEFAKRTLDAINLELLEMLLFSKQEIAVHSEKGRQLYEIAVLSSRQKLQQMALGENLMKGLLLSSQVLSKQIVKYADVNPKDFRKDELQVEHSVIKYFTRMTAKTSPFSTFTNLVKGKISNQAHGFSTENLPEDSIGSVRSHLRLNNYLLQYLKVLLSKNPAVVRELPIRVNPTLEIRGDHYLFLTNNNNIEAFQRISNNPLTDFLLDLIQGNENLVYRTMVNRTLEEIDATEEELIVFINQLIEYGLLEIDFGVSGVDPEWDEKLRQKLLPLAQHGVRNIQKLIDALLAIRQLAGEYEVAGLDRRPEIIDEAFLCFRTTCLQLHEDAGLPEAERKDPEVLRAEFVAKLKEMKEQAKEAGKNKEVTQQKSGKDAESLTANEETKKEEGEESAQPDMIFKHRSSTFFSFKREQIFYEDSTRPDSIHVNQPALTVHLENLKKIMSYNFLFRGNYEEQLKMADYFIKKYGSETEVSLLTFYEDFYRDVKKPENERVSKQGIEAEHNKSPANKQGLDPVQDSAHVPPKQEPVIPQDPPGPLVSSFRKDRDAFNVKLRTKLASMISKSDRSLTEIIIDDDFLKELTSTSNDSGIYGAFLQLFGKEDGGLCAVVNGSFPGFGKMFGRFLHIFDPALLGDLRKWNRELVGNDMILLENTDASYFNANLHPPLLPFEIRIPGGHNSLDSDHQLAVSEFKVNLNHKESILQLKHVPTGKRAYVLDLGFQGHMGRSQLFQLLDKFSKAEYLSTMPLTNIINGICSGLPVQKNSDFKILPRVSFGNDLILQRKKWSVPKDSLPKRQPNDSDFEFYKKVIMWKYKLELPDDVFVFTFQRTFAPGKKKGKAGRDDYKPQYINFKVPALVNLFERLTKKVDDFMRIEEMLPAPDQLLSVGGQRYVTENIVEWNG